MVQLKIRIFSNVPVSIYVPLPHFLKPYNILSNGESIILTVLGNLDFCAIFLNLVSQRKNINTFIY